MLLKDSLKLFLVFVVLSQLSSCVTYKVDNSGQKQTSPSDRIDDVQQRNKDLFDELN
jgi:hypothetical protein